MCVRSSRSQQREMASRRALQVVLFGMPPFYCFPWKPLLNIAAGDRYEVAYDHFVVHHRTVVNVALHLVCMAAQLSGNFGLLAIVDAELTSALGMTGSRPCSAATAVMWVAHLAWSPAPLVYTACSAACIGAAYWAAPLLPPGERLALLLQCLFFAAIALALLLRSRSRVPGTALDGKVRRRALVPAAALARRTRDSCARCFLPRQFNFVHIRRRVGVLCFDL